MAGHIVPRGTRTWAVVAAVVLVAGAGTGWAVWQARDDDSAPGAATPTASASTVTATPSGGTASATPGGTGTAVPAPSGSGSAAPGAGGADGQDDGGARPGGGDAQPGDGGAQPGGGDPRRTATVRVVYAGWDAGSSSIVVSAVVADVIEDGGTCTVTATRGGAQASASGTAAADATTTSCGEIAIPRSSLDGSGAWSVTVAYTSAAAAGTSAATQVVVP